MNRAKALTLNAALATALNRRCYLWSPRLSATDNGTPCVVFDVQPGQMCCVMIYHLGIWTATYATVDQKGDLRDKGEPVVVGKGTDVDKVVRQVAQGLTKTYIGGLERLRDQGTSSSDSAVAWARDALRELDPVFSAGLADW